MYVEEFDTVPFKILNYLIAEINYGGRVTDFKDEILIKAIINSYYDDNLFNEFFKFSDSGIYYPPKCEELSQVFDYLETLPVDDEPEIFGLHNNANITLQSENVRNFMTPLIAIQPRNTSSALRSPDERVLDICIEIESKFSTAPKLEIKNANPLSIYDEKNKTKKSSLGNFLLQEVDKFNNLTKIISNNITLLKLAVQGKIVMSPVLEKIYNSFYENKVPQV
jgi:dynein heavy chain